MVTIPRKTSLSGGQPPLPSRETGLPSPRNRAGFGPSFDGVLNGPESWTSRRRATEGLSKAEAAISPQGDREDGERLDGKDSDIKEEDEDRLEERLDSAQNDVLVIPASQQDVSGDGSRLLDMQPVDRNSANSSIAGRNIPETSNTATMDLASAPPGIPDLASVEWSYLDPQGQVQGQVPSFHFISSSLVKSFWRLLGPFRADVMQKWYDEGYFSIDLLMKRTHSDIEWTPVGELARRTEGEKIFLSPLTSSLPPPGLARRNETPLQIASPSTDQSGFNSAYQPAPARPLRASTLDSFVSNASNPSDSPSSSFGVGRYGSPDPSAFGGRAAGNPYPIKESSVGRVGSFQSVSDPQPPFPSVRRGGVFNDLVPEPSLGRTPSFGNIAPGRGSTVDNFGGFEGGYSSNQPWSPSSGNAIEPNFDTMPVGRGTMETGPFMSNMGSTNTLHQSVAFNQRGHQDPGFNDGSVGAGFNSSAYNAMNDLAPPRDVQQASRPMVDDGMVGTPGFGYNYVNDFRNAPLGGFQGQQYPNTSSVSHIPSQQILRAPPTLGQAPSNPILEASNRDSFLQSPNVPPSPWTAEPPTRRPGPFDPLHPTVKNTAVPPRSITPSQPPWTRTSQNSPSDTNVNEASPWFTASQNAPDDTWKDISAPHSLTFSNVGQHNQQQQEQKSIRLSDNRIPVPATAELETATAPIPIAAVIEPKPAAPASGSTKRRKSNTTHAQAISVEVPLPPTKGPSPPPSAGHVKPAWSNEDEAKKSKPSGLAQGLREIQEAEAKKAEAKKAAERERERAARHATAPTTANEESQPFIASWGLPTSQAGSARTSNNQKDPPGAAPSHPNAPVWTTTGKSPATKKTMKEIQEEEETRKKLAVKETVATAAARRAYAETTNKVSVAQRSTFQHGLILLQVVSTAPSSGGAWTTVGASGKPSSAILNPTRPSITPSTSATSVSGTTAPSRPNGTAPPRPPPSVAAKSAPSPTKPAKIDDHLTPPSHEFLKWLSDSLSGLNSSVNGMSYAVL